MSTRWFAAALIAMASGCSSVKVVDTVDDTFDLSPWYEPSGTLHGRYVAGAVVTFDILGDHEDVSQFTLTADAPLVSVTPPEPDDISNDDVSVTVTLLGAGDFNLLVQNGSGHTVKTQPIHVALPDRVDFLPSGQLFVHDTSVATQTAPQIMAGGTATFMARYFENGELLFGSGGLTLTQTGGLTTEPEQTLFSEVRDWAQVTAPSTPGAATLALVLADTTVLTVPFTVVEDSVITSVSLLAESEQHAASGEQLAMLGQSFSADNQPVWGADYQFTIDGTLQPASVANQSDLGFGKPFATDMFIYHFDKSDPVTVEAAHGTLSDGVLIHSEGGMVASSNNIGCATTPGRTSSPVACLLIACALFLVRRRS